MATVDAFLEGTVGALETPGDIVLDLTKLTFIDSSGLQAVVALAQRVVDGGVILRCPPPNVLRVLDILGVNGAVGIRIEG
jgi:anti-anti-sigma factor